MKVFLAEDDPNIQAIAQVALSRVGGHDVTVFNDGQEIVDALENDQPELILLDVMMPNLNGFDACEKIKADDKLKNIPIIFLTAKAQVHEIQHGMSLGAIGYILKPFDPMQLDNEIKKLLKKEKQSESNAA